MDRRRFPRLDRSSPPRVRGDPRPSRPVVINASDGGVCLWLPDPPSMGGRYVICWRTHGRQQVIGLRPVWLQPWSPAPDPGDVRGPGGWLGGFAFAPAKLDGPSPCLPQDILTDPQTVVESFLENLPPGSPDPESAAKGWTVLSDGIEDSQRVLQAHQDTSAPPARPAGHQSATRQSARARRRIRGGRTILVGAGLVAAVIGWMALTTWIKADRSSGVAKAPLQQQLPPGWAMEMDANAREGWMKIQSRYGLHDATILSAIRILKGDDKYPHAHWLRDLTAYPAQVERAFAIPAGSGKGVPRNLGSLVKDLEMRLVSGSTFPDEPVGERHLGGSRALEDNTVVLAVLDLLRRREDEVAVKDLLAAIRQRAK